MNANQTNTNASNTTPAFARLAQAAAAAAVLGFGVTAASAAGIAQPVATTTATTTAATAPAEAAFADSVIASGDKWVKKTSKTKGYWEIVRRDDGSRVLRLGDNFKTKKAPDLKLVLSPHTTKQAKSKNALEGGTVLGLLASHKGAQEFVIPDSVDLGSFSTVLIHCEQYTKLWSASELVVTSG
ncbi:MAG: DM13 domain-containing protein [Planctomycetota bacterium]